MRFPQYKIEIARKELVVMTLLVSGFTWRQAAYILRMKPSAIDTARRNVRYKLKRKYGEFIKTDIFHITPLIEKEWILLKEEQRNDRSDFGAAGPH